VFLVGLTGGIASGKTLVSDTFASLGVVIIDADVLARVAVAKGSDGLQQLVDHFGKDIETDDGELDRAALRTLIFNDNKHREKVDGILHPIIRSLSDEQIEVTQKLGQAYAIYAVPLLVETNQHDRFDRVLVVDVPVDVQLERIVKRDGGTKARAQAIVNAQASREERLAIADDVIDNSRSVDAVRVRVEQLHAQYLQLAEN